LDFYRIFDFGLTEEDVSAAGAPQHLLECGQAFAKNDAGDEAKVDAAAGRVDIILGNELLVGGVVALHVELEVIFHFLISDLSTKLQTLSLLRRLRNNNQILDLYPAYRNYKSLKPVLARQKTAGSFSGCALAQSTPGSSSSRPRCFD